MLKDLIKKFTPPDQRNKVRAAFSQIRKKAERFQRPTDPGEKFTKPYKLHLGCGPVHLEGFCNVDAMDTSAVDIIDDISTLNRFPNGCAKEIYACHVLEHFSHDEVPELLKRWSDVLMPGGLIRISVPDLDKIVRIYHKNFSHFET